MLRWRLISAAIILAMLLTLIWLDARRAVFGLAGAWLLPVLIGVALLGTEELLGLLRAKNYRPVAWVLYVGNAAIGLAASLPLLAGFAGSDLVPNNPLGHLGWPLVALALSSVAVLVVEMQRYERPGTATLHVALGVFALVYVGLLTSFMALLRLLATPVAAPATGTQSPPADWGLLALLSVLVVVKSADTGAYAFGRLFGRTKMTPRLSPGKTWEGAIGGLATACVASWALFHFAGPALVGKSYMQPQLWAVIAYGLALAIAGMIGDLAESMLKRDMERKDSSTWLPGLGGVLDIVDAVLVAAPVAYVCWIAGLLGPIH